MKQADKDKPYSFVESVQIISEGMAINSLQLSKNLAPEQRRALAMEVKNSALALLDTVDMEYPPKVPEPDQTPERQTLFLR